MVGTLFSLFWLLGWSVGVATLLAVFLIVAFGEETLQLRPGWLTVRIEVLRMGLGADFQAVGTANPRWEPGSMKAGGEQAGNAWRGDHLAFDYGGETIRVGSAVSEARCGRIVEQIQSLSIDQASGSTLPRADTRGIDLGTLVENPVREPAATRPTIETGWQAASTRALILANLIPLIGVLIYDWNIGEIMLLFWAESAIIGFFNLLKMWVIGRWSILFVGPVFIGHYGGFMIVHLLFIYTLFLSGAGNAGPTVSQVLADFVRLWPALLGLVASHAVSFRMNFLYGGEFQGVTIKQQMGMPYRRIVVMHLTIILGGFLAMALKTPLLALVLLIILKIIVDVKSHVRERGQSSAIGRKLTEG